MARALTRASVHLDAVRGIAAFVVFAGHARVIFIGSMLGAIGIGAHAQGAAQASKAAVEFPAPGHAAVIVFFVLSGYLVGGTVLRAWKRGVFSWREYGIQRLTRLWIVLIPALVLTLILDKVGIALFGLGGIYGGPAGQWSVDPNILERLSAQGFFGSMFFVQNILTTSFGSNNPLWTLAFEFWFYVSFPVLLAVVTNRFSVGVRMAGFVVLIAMGWFVGPKIIIYYSFWLAGMLLELVPKALPKKTVAVATPITAVLLLVVCVGLIKLRVNLLLADVIETFFCWIMLYCLIHKTDPISPDLYTRAATGLSNMSYTLYLTHAPIEIFFCAALINPWSLWPLDVQHFALTCAILSATFAIAYGMYWCFEKRTEAVRQFLRRSLLLTAQVPTSPAAQPRIKLPS